MKYFLKCGAQIVVDEVKATIKSAVYRGRELIDGETSLFAVKIRSRDGSSRIVSADKLKFIGYEDKFAVYDSEDLHVGLSIEETENGLKFGLRVKNKTKDLLEWAELPSVSVFGKLRGESGGRGEIVFPFNEGGLITDMRMRESMPLKYKEPDYPSESLFDIFPNVICSQFIAYILDGAGMFIGLLDEERITKHIDFRYNGNNVKLQTRTFCNANYSEDYFMPFDCGLRFFEGDWHDACDIYREWFEKHLPCGLKKIKDNKNLPEWYSDLPLVAIYPVRGKRDTGDMSPNKKFFPYENAVPFLSDLASETDSRVMALLMHWEGTAPWSPPYCYPPYGGEDIFETFLKKAHSLDILVGLYCSGLGYTLKSNIINDYDNTKDFDAQNVAAAVCADSDGSFSSKICKGQRDGFDLCPACEKTKNLIVAETEKICKSGVDYIQILDQNHGGNSYFCYSDKHGHIPAPGKWQAESVQTILDEIDKGNVTFGCESAAAEPFISRLPFSDNRYELNFYIGTPIPVYSYLYHEYVNNFMGNQICSMIEKNETNFTMRLAYSFAAGDALSVVFSADGDLLFSWCDWISPTDKNVEKEVAYKFIKTLYGWRKRGGKNFLHYGRAIKPLKIDCENNEYRLEDGISKLVMPKIITVAYEYEGEKMQFAVNYNLVDEKVRFTNEVFSYFDVDLKSKRKGKEFVIPALSVMATEIP